MSDTRHTGQLEPADDQASFEGDPTYSPRSRSTAYERNNQLLTYGWRALTPGDIARITALFNETPTATPEPLILLEAAFALAACLFTGRTLAEVAALQIAQIAYWPVDGSEVAPGLIKCSSSWGWWLPAGIPGKQKHRNEKAAAEAVARSDHLWLPAAEPVIETLLRVLARRGLRKAEQPAPMFATPVVELRTAMKTLLKSDQAVRRAGTTIEAVERWLTGAVCLTPGGDAAIASIITARRGWLARTTSYYSSIKQTQVELFWKAAVQPVTSVDGRQAPAKKLQEQYYGSRYCPLGSEIKQLQQKLEEDVLKAGTELEYHSALTLYTAVLLTLAVALRPTRLPSITAGCFDPETGFGIVHDKDQSDRSTARLAWFPPVAQAQLDIYRTHIRILDLTGEPVTNRVGSPEVKMLKFFAADRSGRIRASSTRAVLHGLAAKHTCHFVLNFGRHFMRSHLLGRCSTETLQGFMGHWHHGTAPWGPSSGLDPLLYRDDLRRAIVPLLAEHGWKNVVGSWTKPAERNRGGINTFAEAA